jgi:hypothetical protein
MTPREILPFAVPLGLIQLGLIIYSLIDLFKPERRVKYLGKPIWAVIILLVNLLGPILYLLAGREEG